jgi:diguanylate cyclase (GGDEF)-like protein
MTETVSTISLFDKVGIFINKEKFVEAGLYLDCNISSIWELKKELEDIVIKFQLKPVLFSGIQALSNFAKEETRYKKLAETARKIYIFGFPDSETDMIPGMSPVRLNEDEYTKDIFLIINGSDYYAALIAKEIKKDVFEADKSVYKAFITFERKIINSAISSMNSVLLDKQVEIPPPVSVTDSFLAEVSQKKMKTVLFHNLFKKISDLNDQLYNYAALDFQTGLFNKRYFYLQLIREVNRFDRKKTPFSLIFFSLRFEQDKLSEGETSFDDAHAAMAEVIKGGIRVSDDSGFRIKEKEYAVILGETSEQNAARVAVRIESAFKEKKIPGVNVKMVVTEFNTGKTIKSILEYAENNLKQM